MECNKEDGGWKEGPLKQVCVMAVFTSDYNVKSEIRRICLEGVASKVTSRARRSAEMCGSSRM